MPIDLTGARARVSERVYRDRITIKRNPATRDVELDDDTGEPATNTTAKTTLAADVPCSIREVDRLEAEDGDRVLKRWTIGLDYYLAPDDLLIGDELLVTVSEDPELLGSTLYVTRVVSGTNRVSRRVEAGRSFYGIGQH